MKAAPRSIVLVLFALGLLATLSLGAVLRSRAAISASGKTPNLFPAGTIRLYRATTSPHVLQAIQLRSLTDLNDSAIQATSDRAMSQAPVVATSADGSHYAVLSTSSSRHWPLRPGDMLLQLFDARTARPLAAAHHPAVPFVMLGISADGSSVYGYRADLDWNAVCSPTPFYVLDTRTGRVARRIMLAGPPWEPILVSPNLQRVYTVTGTYQVQGCGHNSLYRATVTAYDMRTGRVLRSVRIPGVIDGSWKTGRKMNGEAIMAYWTPGAALSPDGTQIALLDGHNDTLTLLRAQSLQISENRPVSQPRSTLQTIAAALGLQPDVAQAKGEEFGVELQMQYTADGRSLIVTGARIKPDSHHLYSSSRNLGIRLIDIATGQIRGWLQDNKQIIGIWPSPNGSAIYSTIQSWSRRSGWTTVLRRHDPVTLHITATRTFRHTGNWNVRLYFLQAPLSPRS